MRGCVVPSGTSAHPHFRLSACSLLCIHLSGCLGPSVLCLTVQRRPFLPQSPLHFPPPRDPCLELSALASFSQFWNGLCCGLLCAMMGIMVS